MPKIIKTLTFLCLALPGFAFAADCSAPEPPMNLPNGETASKEEMLQGQQTVQQYMEEAQEYVDCIDANEQKEMRKIMELSESGRKRKRDELVQARKNRNAVVTQMQRTADRFNKALRAYQERQSDS